jgi:hypothetical protein
MTLDEFSSETQTGLSNWAIAEHSDGLLFESIGSDPAPWAWIYFQLSAAEDRPEWFPKGKWATLQFLGQRLQKQALREKRLGSK